MNSPFWKLTHNSLYSTSSRLLTLLPKTSLKQKQWRIKMSTSHTETVRDLKINQTRACDKAAVLWTRREKKNPITNLSFQISIYHHLSDLENQFLDKPKMLMQVKMPWNPETQKVKFGSCTGKTQHQPKIHKNIKEVLRCFCLVFATAMVLFQNVNVIIKE